MTVVQAVSKAKSPQEGMLAIAVALDKILDNLDMDTESEWGEWSGRDLPPIDEDEEVHVEHDGEGNVVVDLPPPDDKTKAERYKFAMEVLGFPDEWPNEAEEYATSYSKGGPYFLYLANRDFVMGLPPMVKQQMLTDVNRFDPKHAREMAIDIMKDTEAGDLDSYLSIRTELDANARE